MTGSNATPPVPRPPVRVSRRAVLRAACLAGVSLVLAACGIEAGDSRTTRPTTAATATPSAAPSGSDRPTTVPASTAPRRPPLRERIEGLLVVGFRGATLGEAPWVRTALADGRLAGVILFDRDQETHGPRNIVSPDQLAGLVGDLRAAAGERSILVAVDQEGGVVTRLSPAHGFPPVASEADIGKGSAADARAWAAGLAATLASVGIDLNLAPVVDLDINPDSPAIGSLGRSFSADPEVVTRLATMEIEAHRSAGVRTTLKHFPGIGSSTTNTDFGVADVTATWRPIELEPFRRLIAAGTADLVMAGHVVNGRLDPDRPASLSRPTVTDVLRGELGWEGVVITDDLQTAAIDAAFGRDEAVLLALEAGNDLLLFANQQMYDEEIVSRVVDVVVAAVDQGRLTEATIDEAWDRVRRLQGA